MRMIAGLVAVVGCILVSGCESKSDLIHQIEVSELHPLGEECNGLFYKLDRDALVLVEEGKGVRKLADGVTVRKDEKSVILEFGIEPTIFQWVLTPTAAEDVVRLESRMRHPLTEAQLAYYKKATGRVPDDVNKIWTSFKGFTLCPART
ncbi:hypothetical protein GGE16_002320 [Rhizobium leguminosarum]|uniref:Lipoprotein n=1 Tax=Rhizobium leguminosarum TaxID=384 RepID=A0AAE2MJJ3_RHILE|nr:MULTISPECIES: hypothetical protein [Rhizobium]MBB4290280.1 hypothetical protein [Rhizobium leguminosarum]MBB4296923.1 hypothetical protein [Rhizobium leguminosarum]MBB4307815.1 hypothetical protein [Rhizobium leguminosarum]MBB4415651.1 hypothetical protein [Rhizobium leguminosarum]MBB4431383.1 hypothetical protein [Rhizobium esperanzae]